MPHLIISDEQIEGIVRFYAGFPGFFFNLLIFLSSAGGQLLVGPLRPLRGHSRLPARVMQPSGLRPSPTDAAAETKR